MQKGDNVDDQQLLEATLDWIRENGNHPVTGVLAWRVYEDRVAVVIEPGPKYTVPRSELKERRIPGVNATDSAWDEADRRGIDLTTITGTGRDGRIVKRDVLEAVAVDRAVQPIQEPTLTIEVDVVADVEDVESTAPVDPERDAQEVVDAS